LFDNALEAAVDAIESAGVDLTGCEATLLRDLRGKLRLHVVRPPDAKWPDAAKTTLKKALASIAPFGTDVVYLGGHKEDPLTSVVERDRVPLPPEVVGSTPRVATWFKVERRLSKDAWIIENQKDQEPWPLAVDGTFDAATPPVLSFYGFKGGMGRTTALAAFALYLANDLARNVVVVDLDLEAPGISALLLGDAIQVDLGVADFLLEAQIGRHPPLAMSRFLLGSPFGSGAGSVRVVPAGRLDSHYLEKLGRVDVHGIVEPGAQLRSPLLRLLERVRDEAKPDVILLDVRAGLHDLGGVSLSGLSHLELIFASHTSQTWAGLPLILRHLGLLRAGWIRLVHTMIPPASRGGDALHADFMKRAYDECCAAYYLEDEVPAIDDEDAAHAAYRLPFREALMAISDLGVAKADLLSDEHRRFCERLADDVGLGRSL
jgi:hypothetical protein